MRVDAEYKEPPLVVWPERMLTGLAPVLKSENDQHQFAITGPANLPVGTYPVQVMAYGLHKARGSVRRATVMLDVNDPLSITATPAGPITVAQSQKLKISAIRRGADRQPATLTFEGLPAGVTVANVNLAADQDTVEVDIAAAADAAVGAANQLKIKAVSKYQEQEVVAQTTFGIEVCAAQ